MISPGDADIEQAVVAASTTDPCCSRDEPRMLADEEKQKLDKQECITEFKRRKLENEAAVNWDKFYKRNATKFFKDRHWTDREFRDLCPEFDWSALEAPNSDSNNSVVFLEAGCGVGNLLFPLVETFPGIFAYGMDFSRRSIDFIKSDTRFTESRLCVFVFDLSSAEKLTNFIDRPVDICSLVFVLSAIPPQKWVICVAHLASVMRSGAALIFRDYAINDHAMVRFGPRGSKIDDRFYTRQDGTLTYFFKLSEVEELFSSLGFECAGLSYVHRQTVNAKEGISVPRIFVQGKFVKL